MSSCTEVRADELVCPKCGTTELATTEKLLGRAGASMYRLPNGELEIDHDGYTNVNWDSSETVGIECCSCGSSFKPEELVLADDYERPYECEDCQVNGGDCREHGEAFKLAHGAILANPDAVIEALRRAELIGDE